MPFLRSLVTGLADVSLLKVALGLGSGIAVAGLGALVLSLVVGKGRQAGHFTAFFLTLVCVYALGFAARYYLIEILP